MDHTASKQHRDLFPAFLNIQGKTCIIIGGGDVAGRKAESLMECGADTTVISPRVTPRLEAWVKKGQLTWRKKTFTPEDLDTAFAVFAATDSSDENKRIVDACRQKDILVNAADEPRLCDFFVPSVLRRKSLSIAVSTEGKSPLLAKNIREALEEVITADYGEFLEMLGSARSQIRDSVTDISQRRTIYEKLVSQDMLALVKAGKLKEAKERIEQCISSLQD